jgi:hypothetical protein
MQHEMKKTFLFLLILVGIMEGACAQKAREEIRQNINLAGSNYVAYRGPQQRLTPSPKGYEPFYISHYGRHGSRYLIGTTDYDKPYEVLLHADSLGRLTSKGRETLAKLKLIREEAAGRDGELTLLGAEQHRAIARRMFNRFPQVFRGATDIDARSTVVIRCILSMENALQELTILNPRLRIRHDASYHDMYYMNDGRSPFAKARDTQQARDALEAFNARHTDYSHLMTTLFTEREVYDFWQMNNAFWYMYYGPSRQTNGAGPYTQTNLLRNIIATADTCLRKPHPGATLRFGHEVNVMPLVCLLELNHYGRTIDDLEQLDDRGWLNYNIFPMGCNVQFIFYRPKKGSLADADILVKVLLNEDEATLPLPTDRAPYYHWKDVRNYYLQKISDK